MLSRPCIVHPLLISPLFKGEYATYRNMPMPIVYNHKLMEARRRELRGNMTPAEKLFWAVVRREQLLGVKFRRQYSIGAYVVDFYAAIPRLAVEIDGEYHLDQEAQAYDFVRQVEIENCGISFIRFTNQEIFTDIDGVVARLVAVLEERLTQRSHSSP